MAKYGMLERGAPEMALLHDAFRSTAGWEAYKVGMRGSEVHARVVPRLEAG
jgi:hypothetical protein